MKSRMYYLIPVAVLVLLVAGTAWFSSRPPKVEVVKVIEQEMADILAVSGQVRGRLQSELAPEIPGRIAEIMVDEGQEVEAGELLATLDPGPLLARLERAKKDVETARADLAVTSLPPLPSEFAEAKAAIKRDVDVASAALKEAQQRQLEAVTGPRDEEIERARAELDKATAEHHQQSQDLERSAGLFEGGAISEQEYERAQTRAAQSAALLEAARQQLEELKTGTRPEKLEQAAQEVASAEAQLRAAHQVGQSKLEQLQSRPRPEQVELAQSRVEGALAAQAVIEKELEQTELRAPYRGSVGHRLRREGTQAGPQQPILTFNSRPEFEIRVEIDESERSRVLIGQQAVVRANGYDEEFGAKVEEFAGEINSLKGTVEARLFPDEPPEWLVPGQTVDVNIILSSEANRLLVPLTSVKLKGHTATVLVVSKGRLVERSVVTSSPSESGYLINSGLEAGERVVRYPHGFSDGQRVRI